MENWSTILVQAIGVLVQGAGAAIVFAHWRARSGLGGGALAIGWALILLGAAPWFASVSVERALAIGMLAPAAFGLLLVGPDALARLKPDAARKARARQQDAAPETELAEPGWLNRTVARWFSGLIAAPALALGAAAAWQAFVPGPVPDKVVYSSFTVILVWTLAALWLLSTSHPWRSAALACGAAIAFGGGAYAFAVNGGA